MLKKYHRCAHESCPPSTFFTILWIAQLLFILACFAGLVAFLLYAFYVRMFL